MKIGLVDVDGKWPNLALMKIYKMEILSNTPSGLNLRAGVITYN